MGYSNLYKINDFEYKKLIGFKHLKQIYSFMYTIFCKFDNIEI